MVMCDVHCDVFLFPFLVGDAMNKIFYIPYNKIRKYVFIGGQFCYLEVDVQKEINSL